MLNNVPHSKGTQGLPKIFLSVNMATLDTLKYLINVRVRLLILRKIQPNIFRTTRSLFSWKYFDAYF